MVLSRALIAGVLLVTLVAQLVTPAFARPDGDGAATSAAADTSAPAAAGPATATAPPPLTREDRYWAQLVRACSASARHIRLHFSGRTVETEAIEPEAAGLRFRAPPLGVRTAAITEATIYNDTLVAWGDISRVEVRNVASAGEGAATGTFVGLAIAVPVALVVSFGAVLGSVYTFKQQDSHTGWIFVGAAALGMALGAAGSRHRNGGWVTCCERDTSAANAGAESTP